MIVALLALLTSMANWNNRILSNVANVVCALAVAFTVLVVLAWIFNAVLAYKQNKLVSSGRLVYHAHPSFKLFVGREKAREFFAKNSAVITHALMEYHWYQHYFNDEDWFLITENSDVWLSMRRLFIKEVAKAKIYSENRLSADFDEAEHYLSQCLHTRLASECDKVREELSNAEAKKAKYVTLKPTSGAG